MKSVNKIGRKFINLVTGRDTKEQAEREELLSIYNVYQDEISFYDKLFQTSMKQADEFFSKGLFNAGIEEQSNASRYKKIVEDLKKESSNIAFYLDNYDNMYKKRKGFKKEIESSLSFLDNVQTKKKALSAKGYMLNKQRNDVITMNLSQNNNSLDFNNIDKKYNQTQVKVNSLSSKERKMFEQIESKVQPKNKQQQKKKFKLF